MSISFVNAATGNANNTTTINLTWPTVDPDDTALLFWGIGNSILPASTPSGFSLVTNQDSTQGNSRAYIYRKQTAGSEDGTTLTLTTDLANRQTAALCIWRGCDPTNPIGDWEWLSHQGTANASHPCPQITIPRTGSQVVVAVFERNTNGTSQWTPPTGYTERADIVRVGTGGTATGVSDDGLVIARTLNDVVTPPDYVSGNTPTPFASASVQNFTIALQPPASGYSDNSDMFPFFF